MDDAEGSPGERVPLLLCVPHSPTRSKPQSQQGTSMTASFFLRVVPCNTMLSPMSQPDAPAGKKIHSRDGMAALQCVGVYQCVMLRDDMKNVSSLWSASDVLLWTRNFTRFVADSDFRGHRSAVSGSQHFNCLPTTPPLTPSFTDPQN